MPLHGVAFIIYQNCLNHLCNVDTLRAGENGRNFADNIYKFDVVYEPFYFIANFT